MRICPLIATLLLSVAPAFSQSFQWDQAAALANPKDQLVKSLTTRLLLSREVAWSKFCTKLRRVLLACGVAVCVCGLVG